LIFTDSKKPTNIPKNVKFIKFSLEDFNKLASKKLDMEINITYPYKICDLRPAFGIIFEKYLKNYDFWGHSDLDGIYGNIRKFISKQILNKYDIITANKHYLLGHFTLYKNTYKINRLFKKADYKKIFKNPIYMNFDECNSFFEKFRKGKEIPNKSKKLNLTYIIKKLEKKGKIKVFFQNLCKELWNTNENIKIIFNKGKLKDLYSKNRELMYFHFLLYKNNNSAMIKIKNKTQKKFIITNRNFIFNGLLLFINTSLEKINNLKKTIEKNRYTKGAIWSILILLKDFIWYLESEVIGRTLKPIKNSIISLFYNPSYKKYLSKNKYPNFEIFCINLKKRTNKKNFMKKQFHNSGLNAKFINAVDGNKLNKKEIIKKGILTKNAKSNAHPFGISKPEIGCFLSHIKLWKKLANSQSKNLFLIFEDDAKIKAKKKGFIKLAKNLPADFDICNLNHRKCHETKIYSKHISYFTDEAYGTTSYFISKKGAKKLLKYCLPIKMALDEQINELTLQKKINTYISTKNFIIECSDISGKNYLFKSDIHSREIINNRNKRFIILGRARTGSNLLKSFLESHHFIDMKGELFNFNGPTEKELEHIFKNPKRYLINEIYTYDSRKRIIRGFKIFYNHFEKGGLNLHNLGFYKYAGKGMKEKMYNFNNYLKKRNIDKNKIKKILEKAFKYIKKDKRLFVIHLKRRNLLKTYFSELKAWKTDQWFEKKQEKNAEKNFKPVKIDYQDLLGYLKQTEFLQKKYDEIFKKHKKIEIFYEDLVNQKNKTMKKIFNFLGVPYVKTTTNLKKQNTLPLSKSISNYKQLKQKFKRTKYEKFFEQ
jgi:GR25 family glycosyltransferase involved in LPS biosynthesis